MSARPFDCLIVGAGPAGLTAALYLARFRRNVMLVDAGQSRAELIPTTHNYPGFPQGISGIDLLRRLREQMSQYPVLSRKGRVEGLSRRTCFTARIGSNSVSATTVLLATGVVDRQHKLAAPADLRNGTLAGQIRWCPICDGYEVLDRNVGLIGTTASAPGHALFLRTYTSRVTLMLAADEAPLPPAKLACLQAADIKILEQAPVRIELAKSHKVAIHFAGKVQSTFDTIYPMLGSQPQSGLATDMGARCDELGELIVDEHQQTSVPGLYAAGDLVRALNQMSVGMAHAAIAATAIHNRLAHNPR